MLYSVCTLVLSFTICSGLFIAASYDSVKITLHVFSGTRDPYWVFNKNTELYNAVVSLVQDVQSTPLASRLGYTGFSIEFVTGSHTTTLTVGMCKNKNLEMSLLSLIKGLVPSGDTQPLSNTVLDYVQTTIMACQ